MKDIFIASLFIFQNYRLNVKSLGKASLFQQVH